MDISITRTCPTIREHSAYLGVLLLLLAVRPELQAAPAPMAVASTPATRVSSVAVSPDGRQIASGYDDGTTRMWDIRSGKLVRSVRAHQDRVTSASFSPNGRVLATASRDGTARLWDVRTGTGVATLAGHTGAVNAIAYSPTGNLIASGSADKTIRLWNATTGALERTLTGHQGGVKSLAFSPNGETLVSASGEFDDQGAKVWNLKDGTVRQLVERDGYWVHYLAFAPNGKLVAAALAMRRGPVWVSVYEVGTGNLVRVVDPEKLTESIAFSPDSNAFVTAGHNNVLIWWRLPQGTATFTLRGHKAYITGVAFVPGGRQIVSGSADGTVRVWRIATRTLERTFSVK